MTALNTEMIDDLPVGSEVVAHELAELLPMIDDASFGELKDSISKHGILEPITLLDGKVLDGRNRLKACVELGIPCPARTVENLSPADAVAILNIHRRHLNPSQIAMFFQGMLEHQARLAKERQLAAQNNNAGRAVKAKLPEQETGAGDTGSGDSAEAVAKAAGVSARTLKDAKVVSEKGTPEQIKSVVQGKAAVSTTAKAIRKKGKGPKAAKPKRKTTEAKSPLQAFKSAWRKADESERVNITAWLDKQFKPRQPDLALRIQARYLPRLQRLWKKYPKMRPKMQDMFNDEEITEMAKTITGKWDDDWPPKKEEVTQTKKHK